MRDVKYYYAVIKMYIFHYDQPATLNWHQAALVSC